MWAMLESIVRRPQRLLLVVVVCIIVLFSTTYLSLSASGTELLRDKLQYIPGWSGNRAPSSMPAGMENAFSNISSPVLQGAGVQPQTVDDLRKLAHVGDDTNLYPPEFVPHVVNKAPRAKAGFIVLVRNQELEDMRSSMRDVEDRFNRKYGYPWIFLNDKPFTEEFKKGVKQMTRSECRFGKIGEEHWGFPEWIDKDRAAKVREEMKKKKIIYGDSVAYRHMCRFNSGFFFRHPLTFDLDYYWRVEPGIHLYCDIDYDPFVFMQINNKVRSALVAC